MKRGERIPTRERILKRITILPSGCWEWQGTRDQDGYAVMAFTIAPRYQRKAYVHRVAYEEFREPIPDGLVIDHLCRVRACVNPDHLEAVTDLENKLRGLVSPAKTHCLRGHEYTPENTWRDPVRDKRKCRTCVRMLRRKPTKGEAA